MSSRKNNKHSGKFDFTTFQLPKSIKESIPVASTQTRRAPKRFAFQDPEENIHSEHINTPIEIINQDSNQIQREKPQEQQQIIVIPAPSLVEEDKPEANLDFQTRDSLQRETTSISPLHKTVLSQLVQFVDNHKVQDRIRHFFDFYYNIQRWLDACQNCLRDNRRTCPAKEQLRRWVQDAIKQAQKQNCRISFRNNSEMLDYVLSGNEKQLIAKLTSQGKYFQSLIVSNIWDTVSRDNLDKGFLIYKKDFNLIKSCSLDILAKSCWLYELILSTDYFTESPLLKFGAQIFDRYISHPNNVFKSELVLLGLFCRKRDGSSGISEEDLMKALRGEAEDYTEAILLLFLLSDYKAEYPNAYFNITQAIIKKISNPSQLIKIFQYTSLSFDQINPLFQTYLTSNSAFTSNRQQYPELRALIKNNQGLDNQNPYFKVLLEWTTSEEVKQLHEHGKNLTFIETIIHKYQVLKRSSDNLKILMNQLKESVVSFKLTCNYKKQKRKDFYHLLDQLENTIAAPSILLDEQSSPQEKSVLDLVRGIKSFLQLSLGIFNLVDPIKLEKIHDLHSYLTQRLNSSTFAQHQNDIKRFKNYLEEAVVQALQSREGNIYLTKLLSQQQGQGQKKLVVSTVDSYPDASTAENTGLQSKRQEVIETAERSRSKVQQIGRIVGKRGVLLEKIKLAAVVQ